MVNVYSLIFFAFAFCEKAITTISANTGHVIFPFTVHICNFRWFISWLGLILFQNTNISSGHLLAVFYRPQTKLREVDAYTHVCRPDGEGVCGVGGCGLEGGCGVRGCLPRGFYLGVYTAPLYSQPAGGTHPTGMHTYFDMETKSINYFQIGPFRWPPTRTSNRCVSEHRKHILETQPQLQLTQVWRPIGRLWIIVG